MLLSVLSLAASEAAWAAPVFLVFFGLAAIGAAVHALPGIAVRWPALRVRPGSVKAVAVFVAAALHWLVAAGALAGVFLADTLWQSVPMFFATVLSLAALSLLFAASGYFLYSWERVGTESGGD